MELSGKSCLVAGGAGFIGSALVSELLKRNCRVQVIDDFSTGNRKNLRHVENHHSLSIVSGTILNTELLDSLMANAEFIFNLACLGVRHSLSQPVENHLVNSEGALQLLIAARKAGIKRFIHCSSSEVYGTTTSGCIAENHPTLPHTVYGASKLSGEAYARAFYRTYGFPVVIARPFNTYGPRSHHEGESGELIPKTVVRALGGRSLIIFGDGSNSRDFTYVDDSVSGIISLAEVDSAVGGTFNITSGDEIDVNSIVSSINSLVCSGNAKVERLTARPGDVARLHGDSEVLFKISGWRAGISFAEGLSRTVDYFRNHPGGIQNLLDNEIGQNWKSI